MQAAADIPIVQESDLFISSEEARLQAMEDAQNQSSDEGRLELTLVVTDLYQRQVDTVGSEVMADLQEAAGTPDANRAAEWITAWLSAAETGLHQWAEFQRELVDRVGHEE